jgi:hypothetical protein
VSTKVIEAGMETGCCKRLQDANYKKWPDTAVRSTASLALEDAESVHEERLNNKAVSIVFIYYFILIDLVL